MQRGRHMVFYKWVSWIVGILSLILLIKQGWDVGFVAALQTIIEYYRSVMEFLFGWAEPYIRIALQYLEHLTGIALHLSPEWKHLFFLLGIYFSNDATNLMFNDVRPNTPGADRRYFISGLSRLIFGLVLAFVVSVAIGSVASGKDLYVVIGGSALIAILGVWLFEVFTAFLGAQLHRSDLAAESDIEMKSWTDEFLSRVDRGSWHALFAIGAVSAGVIAIQILAPTPTNPAALGTGILAILIFFFACFWLYRGLRHSYEVAKKKRVRWRDLIATSRNVNLGRGMLRIYLGAFAFLVLNAGLKLAGL